MKLKFVSDFVELFDRSINLDKSNNNIYKQDIDNLYPNRVEVIEKKSVTANACANKLFTYIVGDGFINTELNNLYVNKRGLTAYQFLKKLAYSLKTHKGAYIHVNYDTEGKTYLDVFDYKSVRKSKEDVFGYEGCFYVKDWAEKKQLFNFNKKGAKWFYPFNNDINVINSQKKRDGVDKYRGQVYFLNLDNNIYPYAWLDACLNDADTEMRISLYRNTQVRTGFLGKDIILTKNLDEEVYQKLKVSIKDWLGAENSSGVFTLNIPDSTLDLSDVLKHINIPTNYNSKQFTNDEERIENNIRKCYLYIPKALIEDSNGAIFSQSGAALLEAQKMYNRETQFIRDAVSDVLKLLKPSYEWEIKNLNINE